MPTRYPLGGLFGRACNAALIATGTEVARATEAAVGLGWERWLRPRDVFIGVSGCGASGMAEALYWHFGPMADGTVDAVRGIL